MIEAERKAINEHYVFLTIFGMDQCNYGIQIKEMKNNMLRKKDLFQKFFADACRNCADGKLNGGTQKMMCKI